MSDAENPDDEFEPVQVFGDEEGGDLRPGSDDCYKCSTCDTNCPVAEVDDDFPGPKFQGPEQWRLKRKEDTDIDDSVMKCSNCMRCDGACPSNVPLSQMHNTARGEYVDEQMEKLSREYVRNRILSNYRFFASLGSKMPRLANFVMGLGVTSWLGEKVMGISSEREMPEFAAQTFREWWSERGGNAASKKRAREARVARDAERPSDHASGARPERSEGLEEANGETVSGPSAREQKERGGAQVSNPDKRIAYFHGCYSNYNTPEVGKALVRVFEHFGYEVVVPPQRCSGTPMFANGMVDDARRAAETNVEEFVAAIGDGADVIASCTSCSLSLRQEYPELFDIEGIDDLSAHAYEAVEYLRIYEDLDGELDGTDADFPDTAYHAPCHARNQGLERQAIEVADRIDGVEATDVGDSCSGISGTYGWKEENYDTSMKIGSEMFEHMEETEAETGITECPTCAMQMEHGTGYDIRHPLELLEAALVED